MKIAMALAVISTCLISGCATITNEISDGVTKTQYYDTDGKSKVISFSKYVPASSKELRENDITGYFQDITTGDEVTIFKYSDGKTFSLINLDTAQPIKIITKETFYALGNAKSFKFYEFGKGIIEPAIFQSQNGICKDFNNAQGIKVNFATNYYPNIVKTPNEFFTTYASAKLGEKSENKLLSTKFTVTSNDSKVREQINAMWKKDKDQLLQTDVSKLRSFIKYLCSK